MTPLRRIGSFVLFCAAVGALRAGPMVWPYLVPSVGASHRDPAPTPPPDSAKLTSAVLEHETSEAEPEDDECR